MAWFDFVVLCPFDPCKQPETLGHTHTHTADVSYQGCYWLD